MPGRDPAASVALLGADWLAAALRAELAPRPLLTAPVSDRHLPHPPGPDARVLVAEDPFGDETHRRIARAWAAGSDRAWLPLRLDSGTALLGPAVLPRTPGCPECADRRHPANSPHPAGLRALLTEGPTAQSAPGPFALEPLALLVADEARQLADADPTDARTAGARLRLDLTTLAVTRHLVVPDSRCPLCAAPLVPGPAAARPRWSPAPKPDPGSTRLRSLSPEGLERCYADPVTGLVSAVDTWAEPNAACAVARLAPALAEDATGFGHGRARDFATARLTAVLEALERYGGERPRSPLAPVTARFDEVASDAVDPFSLGLHSPGQHRRPGFPLAEFDPAEPIGWLWGYSFARERPVLVPQSYTCFGPTGPGDRRFVYETSNGLALGGSWTEAALHGLLEVAERDAFLTTWYTRLPAPRVDLDSAADRRIPLLTERTRQEHGYQLHAFATVLEQRVPAFWVAAQDLYGRADHPALLCGAGAHLDPERALLRALDELTGFLAGAVKQHDRARAARLLADPDAVEEMEDHAQLYGHPEAFERLDFLFRDGPAVPTGSLARELPWPEYEDLGQDLAELVQRYLDTGLDVVVVDLTASEHRSAELSCVKVIVPGAVPMSFGHRFRRVDGLPRLLSAPRRLGHRDRDLESAELNPYPHPFP
ncbi:TOMM precursor leader peptide-binding protein [Streptomyces sp. NPDC048442]|uniref:TOMM precursor leader peptide-binding protein n=1 Tax=Streptomyces sp. NPDC048442 TaxID=3154823 RepID=UPI003428C8E8